jgi:hypothetical protein
VVGGSRVKQMITLIKFSAGNCDVWRTSSYRDYKNLNGNRMIQQDPKVAISSTLGKLATGDIDIIHAFWPDL